MDTNVHVELLVCNLIKGGLC